MEKRQGNVTWRRDREMRHGEETGKCDMEKRQANVTWRKACVASALTLTSLVIKAPAVSTSPPLHMLPSTYPPLLLFLDLD